LARIDNKKFYTSALNIHGTTAKGLNWHSTKHQTIRFKTILELLPDDLSTISIVDAGCGFGDFYIYMQKKERLPKEYIGIDSVEELCQIASKRVSQKIMKRDICRETLPTTDYYICSGALNILTYFETYQFIHNCYKSSTKGFIFNTLYGDNLSKHYNYLTKQNIYKIAKSLNIKDILFVDGYLEDDITVLFLKP